MSNNTSVLIYRQKMQATAPNQKEVALNLIYSLQALK